MNIEPGAQIVYTPSHANGDTSHSDSESGFVTSVHSSGKSVYCRYWSKSGNGELRTKSCSELTPIELIVLKDTVPQYEVEDMLSWVNSSEDTRDEFLSWANSSEDTRDEFKVGDFVFCKEYGTHGVIVNVTKEYYHLYWASQIFMDEWRSVQVPLSTLLERHKCADSIVHYLVERRTDPIFERRDYFLSLVKQGRSMEREILFRPGLTVDQIKAGASMAEEHRDNTTGTMSFYGGQCIIAFLQDRITIRLAEAKLNEI